MQLGIKKLFKKVITLVLIMVVLSEGCFANLSGLIRKNCGLLVVSAETTNQPAISVGDSITLGTYNNKKMTWICIAIDNNGPLMLASEIICTKEYDASGESKEYHSDGWGYVRKKYGSNCWQDSNIRQWLNSFGLVNYSHCSPSYVAEKGFLSYFSNEELSCVSDTRQKTYVNELEIHRNGYIDGGSRETNDYDISNVENAYYKNLTDKFFLLGQEQIMEGQKNVPNILRIGEEYFTRMANNSGASYENVITVKGSEKNYSVGVDTDGLGYKNAASLCGIRPAFYLKGNVQISDENYTVDHGVCGEENNIIWTLDKMGALVLTGTGKMINYQQGQSPFANDKRIKTVVMDFNIQNIGSYTFENCNNMRNISLPYFLESIGQNAFIGCSSIEKVYNQNESIQYYKNDKYIDINGSLIPQLNRASSKFGYVLLSNNEENPYYKINSLQFSKISCIMSGYLSNSNGNRIILNENVIYIAPDAFSSLVNLKIYGYSGSYVEQYARIHKCQFVDITPEVHNIDINSDTISHSKYGQYVDNEKKYYINNEAMRNKVLSLANNLFDYYNIKKVMNDTEYSGACFGLNSTIAFSYGNKLNLRNFGSAEKYNKIDFSANNYLYRDMVNYYQLCQQMDKGKVKAIKKSSKEFKSELQFLIDEAEKVNLGADPYLVSINFWDDNKKVVGHSITVCGGKKLCSGEYLLYVFDVNYADYINAGSEKSFGYEGLLISEDLEDCYFIPPLGYTNITAIGHKLISDFSHIDLDGDNNSISYINPKTIEPFDIQKINQKEITKIITDNNSSFIINNKSGVALEVKNGLIKGDLKVMNEKIIDYFVDNSQIYFEIPYSEEYIINVLSDKIDISIGTYDDYYSFAGKKLASIQVDFEKNIKIDGNEAMCQMYVSDLTSSNLINWTLSDFKHSEIDFKEQKININVDNPQTTEVTIFTDNNEETKLVTIDESFTDIGKIGILGDVNSDGNVDIADALMTARYDAGLIQLDETQLSVSDVNKDESVDIADALMVARFDAGFITVL